MNSMTGFGSASQRDRRLDLDVEIRSVNHRYLTIKLNLPEGLGRYEAEIDQMVRARLSRGSVTLKVSLKSSDPAALVLPDVRVLKATVKRLREIQKELRLEGEIEMEDVLAIPSLWSAAQAAEAEGDLWPRAKKLVAKALDALVATREREGAAIGRDLRGRLDTIEKRLVRVQERVPAVVEAYQKRLDDRVRALLAQKGLEVAQPDLAKEVALYADRCDVSEEIQRLRTHTGEFRKSLAADGPLGRRLDFLTQEMGREANTIASKGNDAEISGCSVDIKAELEKIKEQVENIE
jgi:uncharacterized protein (TIGR00255 family)